jgi:hypothetical protein
MSSCDVCCLSSFHPTDTITVLRDTLKSCKDGCILISLFEINVYVLSMSLLEVNRGIISCSFILSIGILGDFIAQMTYF